MSKNDLSAYEGSSSLHNALGVVTIAPLSLSESTQDQDGYFAERHLQGQSKKDPVKVKPSAKDEGINASLVLPKSASLRQNLKKSTSKEKLANKEAINLPPDSNLSVNYEVKTNDLASVPSSANLVIDKILHQVHESGVNDSENSDVLSTVLGVEENYQYEELESSQTLSDEVIPSNNDVPEGKELSAEDLERFSKMSLKEGDICPACSKGTLVLRKNDKVHFLGCSCYPSCKMRYFTALSSPVSNLKILKSLCPNCQSPLAVKKGRYGLFIGCSNYPECNYTHKESEAAHNITCPICSKGTLEKRRSNNGRIFYGCNNYPECKFIVSGVPVEKSCKECCFPLSFKKKVKAGIALVCANPLCASRRKRKYELILSKD